MPESENDQDAHAEDVDTPAETETDEPAVFANRAARRAKGKTAGAQQQTFGNGQRPSGRGAVQSPRQWGNRRSG
jgi:hypothetical protein